ncbi:MAG: signal recognition particle-docking protein FtsY [Treponema sp.]|jgi:fused signal recognition particle receptor|nr:signal recognition particle-docking protein FtsY [Treponema sp.]
MNFAGKIKSFFAKAPAVSPEFFDELSDLLVEGDLGVKESYTLVELLQERCKKENSASPEQARDCLAGLLEEMLHHVETAAGLPLMPETSGKAGPAVILLLGVNGVGKTTTAAKLAALCQSSGAKPVLAAADTFRAAAIDQLKIHGERLGLRVVAHQQGGDPAAVVYDAIEAAGKDGIVIADTAGRMHTKSALVDELRKIDRVVESKAARYSKYLVLDATTGRNAFAQAEIFCEAVTPEAAILSKYDSTAKGGVVFSLASGLRLPVAYLCTGEKYGDIQTFNPHNFAREFAGIN